MKLAETHIVPEGINDIRLSDYARNIFETIPSRKGMKKAIDKGLVKVNEGPASTATLVKTGDQIALFLPDDFKKAYELQVPVIYEDDYIAVVNKPSGFLTNGNAFKTLENTLPFNLQPSYETDALFWPQVAHRLDFPTSGLVVVAKTRAAKVKLTEMFEAREMRKTYHAITIGAMPQQKGVIEALVDSKPATSHYEVVRSVVSKKYECFNLVQLQPITGRRHQLRKHLASIGFPILGDRDYGTPLHWDMKRGLYLAAIAIEFVHPITNEKLSLSIDLPKKFVKLVG